MMSPSSARPQLDPAKAPSVSELREFFFSGITAEREALIQAIPRELATKGTVIITGASKGIGLDCVLMALRDRYVVVGLDLEPADLATEFKSERVSSIKTDITDRGAIEAALRSQAASTEGDIYLVCAAGVYSASNAELCMNVNYHGTINTVEIAKEVFGSRLKGIAMIGSDQSFFDKNSQRSYGTQGIAPYMASKQALREYYERLCDQAESAQKPSFIAPATVITPLTGNVMSELAPGADLRSRVFANWQKEHSDIPEGLLNPHHLAYVIVNSAIQRADRLSPALQTTIASGQGILLDGKLNTRAEIITTSDRYRRFSLTDRHNFAVESMLSFD